MSATLVEAGQPALPSPDPREPKRNLERYGYDLTLMRSSGTEQARHTHRGLELIAVHSGATTVSVGGWMGVLVPGDVLLLDATQVHGVRALSGSYIRTLLHLLPGTVGDFAAIASGNTPRVLSCVDAPVLAHLQSLVAADGMSVAQRQRLLGASLNVLSRQPQRPAWAGLPPTVRTALGCVLDDVTKPGTVRELSRACYVSHGHLWYLFHLYLGCSPQRLLSQLRMEYACRLLLQNVGVEAVARTMMFSSRRGFERAFQRITGVPPATYRDKVGPRVLAHAF